MALKHIEGKHEDSSDLFFWDDVLKDEGPESIFGFPSEIKEGEEKGPGRGWWGPPKGTHGKKDIDGGVVDFGNVDIHNSSEVDDTLKWGRETWSEWYANVSRRERDALEQYGDLFYFREINGLLRYGDTVTIPREPVEDWITHIDSALANRAAVAPSDMIVYRGLGRGSVLRGLSVGDTFSDNGYVSTSLVHEMARQFGPATAEIRVSKGFSCGFMSGVFGPESDFEVLLPRGLDFKIVDREANHYVLEIIENE